nr:ribonuclease H-like domain-containing protein [Tanacetum cinerariifolium]
MSVRPTWRNMLNHYNSSDEVNVNLPTPMLKPQSPINEPTTHSNHVSLKSYSLSLSDSCDTNVGQASIPPINDVETVIPLITGNEKLQRRNEVKARSTLMMGLPNEHQIKFNSIKDAKSLLAAIEKRFGGNDATKKTQRNLLKQQYENFFRSSFDSLDQTFDKLQKLYGEKKLDLDILSMDDLYNNLKIYESEVKGISNSINTQNMAFVSSSSNNSNMSIGVNTAQGVNTANEVNTDSSKANAASASNIDNLSVAVICAFLASQPNSTKLVNGDLEQIHPDDLEEMDQKWQMAMLTIDRVLTELQRRLDLAKSEINKLENASKNLNKIIECQFTDNCKKKLGYNKVPPPLIGLFPPPKSDLSSTGLEELFNEPKTKKSKDKSNEEEVEKQEVKPSLNRINFIKATTDNNPKETVKTSEQPNKTLIGKKVTRELEWNDVSQVRNDNGTEFKNKEMNQFYEVKGKFDGKTDEGFFVRYSLNSKAFRVFNSRTEIVEENLHVRFSENTPNRVIGGPDWLFDIDALTKKMNYQPVTVDSPLSTTSKSSQDNEFQPLNNSAKRVDEYLSKENDCNAQGGMTILTALTELILLLQIFILLVLVDLMMFAHLPPDPNMPSLEDIRIFEDSHDDEDAFGAKADFHNLDSTLQVSLIPTTRIHKDHPLEQVTGDLHLTHQTMRMSKNLEEHGLVGTVIPRTDNKDL